MDSTIKFQKYQYAYAIGLGLAVFSINKYAYNKTGKYSILMALLFSATALGTFYIGNKKLL